MAREAELVNNKKLWSLFADTYTCSDGTAITKGTYLKFTDPFTVSASTGTGDAFAGFAAMDKVASDGSTQITVMRPGRWDLTASGAIAAGAYIKTAAPGNYVMQCTDADVTASTAVVIGRCIEAASNTEKVNCIIF